MTHTTNTTAEIAIPNPELIETSQLRVHPEHKNPNSMTRSQLDKLKASIKKYGFIVPIITNKDLVIADGEQRWIVANELAMPKVLVVRVPLEEVDRLLIQQILNVSAMRGTHDLLLDAMAFEEIINLGQEDNLKYFLDLTDGKLERYLNELHPPAEETAEIPAIDTITTDIKKGDIIQLGKHRLMCGDSTSPADVDRLCEKPVELLFTSPPYIDQRDYGGHDTSTEHLSSFLKTWYKHTNYAAVNLGIIKRNHEIIEYWQQYIKQAKEAGYKFLSWNVWNREMPGSISQQTTMFSIAHEWILFFGKQEKDLNRIVPNQIKTNEKKRIKNVGRNKDGSANISTSPYYQFKTITTVTTLTYEHTRDASLHPARFPVSLPTEYIMSATSPNDVVADSFGGSGSTLMACEENGRTCYTIEIDPRYCEVICQRWEKYTNQKRKLLTASELHG